MDGGNLGIITLIPMLSFFVFAFITRRCVFSILLSGILGFLFYYGADFFEPTVQALLDAACDADNNYSGWNTTADYMHFSILASGG